MYKRFQEFEKWSYRIIDWKEIYRFKQSIIGIEKHGIMCVIWKKKQEHMHMDVSW